MNQHPRHILWTNLFAISSLVFVGVFTFGGCKGSSDASTAMANQPTAQNSEAPHVVASNPVEAGRYIVAIGGCNDCHTDGYMQQGTEIPEDNRLLGSSVGWRGPWGTSYPRNLRLTVQDYTEDQFLEMVHTRMSLPPMPWISLHEMSDSDVKAVYAYIKSLGPKGEQPPTPVGPDEEPATPYLLLVPQNLPKSK